jgi:hypothetical protein
MRSGAAQSEKKPFTRARAGSAGSYRTSTDWPDSSENEATFPRKRCCRPSGVRKAITG